MSGQYDYVTDDPLDERVTKIALRVLEDGRPQYVIAAEAGIPPPRLSEYCTGRRVIPVKHLYRFCSIFRCDPNDIIGYADMRDIAI